jgi:NADH-ubiquinone oxidoreductase chain 5
VQKFSFSLPDEQDMRKMGGLASSFPLTYAMMLMGSLSLIGFPFLTGFYSKDVILELTYTLQPSMARCTYMTNP